jgi:hypothetical protein
VLTSILKKRYELYIRDQAISFLRLGVKGQPWKVEYQCPPRSTPLR